MGDRIIILSVILLHIVVVQWTVRAKSKIASICIHGNMISKSQQFCPCEKVVASRLQGML
jgi:hypothetical protein